MSLTDGEVSRIRAELGYHLIGVDGEPYVGYTSLFDVIIQPYLDAGTSTTSATAVTAASSPTPVTLVLTSATGFSSLARVVIDVDDRTEAVTIQNLSGTSMTVQLSLAHSGTYPVALADSGEGIVREILKRIRDVKLEMASSAGEGGIKQVDEIHFYDSRSTMFSSLGNQLKFWREELSAALGVASAWSLKSAAAQTLSVY